jgi:exonuclease III
MNHLKKDLSDLDLLIQNINVNTETEDRVILLSECCLQGEIQKEILGHEAFIHGDSNRSGGVGIILGGKAIKAWKDAGSHPPTVINGRLMGLHLEFKTGHVPVKLFVISAYLPCTKNSDPNDEEFISCVEDLKKMVAVECKNGIKPVIGGDFNSILGTRMHYDDTPDIKRHLGPNGINEKNRRGDLLFSEILEPLDLCNPASFFIKKDYTTWCNTRTKMNEGTNRNHTLDYILTLSSDFKFVRNSEASTKLSCESDHFAVAMWLKLPIKMTYRKKKPKKRNDNNTKTNRISKRNLLADNPTHAEEYNKTIKEMTKSWQSQNENTLIDQPSLNIILQEASKSFPKLESLKNDWFNRDKENLLKLISEKNEAEKKYSLNRNNTLLNLCRIARRTLKKEIKLAKNNWIKSEISKLQNISIDPYTAWQASKTIQAGLSHHHLSSKQKYVKLKRNDGTFTDDPKEQVKIQSDFFGKEIFGRNAPFDNEAVENLRQIDTNISIANPISLDELKDALKRAKNRKSPGSNGIPIEMYKLLDDENLISVLDILNKYFTDPDYDIPDWHDVTLKLLPKKGDLSLPKNYRPISLLDVLSKILSSILGNRINSHLELHGLKEQAGFMKSRGCADATSSLKITLQNLQAADQDSYVLFVDIVKAFDSVNREMLWQILEKYGIPKETISVIKKMYTDVRIKLSIEEAEAFFNSTSGVKQGDNLAPVLFLFAIQAAVETMHRKWSSLGLAEPQLEWFPNAGAHLNKRSQKSGTSLDHKDDLYADDAAFIFLTKSDLIKGTQFVKECFALFGLEVHLGSRANNAKSKTEAVYFPSHSNLKKEIPEELVNGDFDIEDGRFVSFVPKFKYLGTYLSQSLTEEADIDARILAATKNFNALGRSIFRNRKIPIELRSQLYLAITVNILLWGCDSWALKTTQLSRLSTFHNKCVRQLCGYTMYNVKDYRIRTETCLEKTNLKPIETIITVRQLRFLSRIAQMDESRLTRQVMNSQGIISAGSRAGRNKTTKMALRDALKRAGLLNGKIDIKTSEWIDCLNDEETPSRIENNLGLKPGTFKKRKKGNPFI